MPTGTWADRRLFGVEVAAPLGIADAVEGGVLGETAEGGFVGLGELLQRGFAVVGEGNGSGGLIVIGTGQLADVAAEDITAGVERRRQFGCRPDCAGNVRSVF